jgi:Arc/MetJ family transcription regulator
MPSRKQAAKQTLPTARIPIVGSFLDALHAAEPRPVAESKDKKNYAERLSNKLAVLIANKLRGTNQFAGVLPTPDGRGRESVASSGAHKKAKKTDVNYSTLRSGLELLVSIKTLNFPDQHQKTVDGKKVAVYSRYTRNMVRNDHELRAEAMDHHERHPFAVLAALFFLPIEACDDADTDKSSFAHAVKTFRHRVGREKPTEPPQFFERFYIGLYEWSGENRGTVAFFDVLDAPPKRGRPRNVHTLDEVVADVVRFYGLRNRRYIEWADEQVPSDSIPKLEEPSIDESDLSEDDSDESES